jgi:hypothetical protein
MKTKLTILGGCACLLLAGCSSPQGGTSETAEPGETAEAGSALTMPTSTMATNQGIAPAPTAVPAAPAVSGMNPRDMRDPQALTIPRPGVTLGPVRPNSQ